MKELTLGVESSVNNIKGEKTRKNRKEVFLSLLTACNESEKIKEKELKSFNENKFRKIVEERNESLSEAVRPKSASVVEEFVSFGTDSGRRPKSSEFPRGSELQVKVEPDSAERKIQKKRFEDKNRCCCCCWRAPRPECSSLLNLNSRSWSGCGFDEKRERQTELWDRIDRFSRPRRNCESNPTLSNVSSKKLFDGEREFHKIKRSLRLLGFELSDFGIESELEERPLKKRTEKKSARFSTKVTNRSISLDSLRATVRGAWMDDRFDESHRRLLAQAAYEEWYFKKERELWLKRSAERLTQLKTKESIRNHFERKKERGQEEFRKWLRKKRTKRKKNDENSILSQTNPFVKVTKSKEESEKAFLEWKKHKEEELEKKRNERKEEEKRKLQSEKEKNEKKMMAERAFQQWKTKLKETELQNETKKRMQKKARELQERKKREEGFQISFEMWKALKDEQIKEKTKQTRMECKIAREERLAQMEERLYEAEQAFEDWLEKVELRKQKQFSEINGSNKTIPWIPV